MKKQEEVIIDKVGLLMPGIEKIAKDCGVVKVERGFLSIILHLQNGAKHEFFYDDLRRYTHKELEEHVTNACISKERK